MQQVAHGHRVVLDETHATGAFLGDFDEIGLAIVVVPVSAALGSDLASSRSGGTPRPCLTAKAWLASAGASPSIAPVPYGSLPVKARVRVAVRTSAATRAGSPAGTNVIECPRLDDGRRKSMPCRVARVSSKQRGTRALRDFDSREDDHDAAWHALATGRAPFQYSSCAPPTSLRLPAAVVRGGSTIPQPAAPLDPRNRPSQPSAERASRGSEAGAAKRPLLRASR